MCAATDVGHIHRGVYGVAVRGGFVLLVRKNRGPYKGMLDLPGGRLKRGETRAVALTRELREEMGCDGRAVGPWRRFELHFRYRGRRGERRVFIHRGWWCGVMLRGAIDWQRTLEDVSGVVRVRLKSLRAREDISPLARQVLRSAGVYRSRAKRLAKDL